VLLLTGLQNDHLNLQIPEKYNSIAIPMSIWINNREMNHFLQTPQDLL